MSVTSIKSFIYLQCSILFEFLHFVVAVVLRWTTSFVATTTNPIAWRNLIATCRCSDLDCGRTWQSPRPTLSLVTGSALSGSRPHATLTSVTRHPTSVCSHCKTWVPSSTPSTLTGTTMSTPRSLSLRSTVSRPQCWTNSSCPPYSRSSTSACFWWLK